MGLAGGVVVGDGVGGIVAQGVVVGGASMVIAVVVWTTRVGLLGTDGFWQAPSKNPPKQITVINGR